VGIEIAEHKSAAVEEHGHGRTGAQSRPVDADPGSTRARLDLTVLASGHLRPGRKQLRHSAHPYPRAFRAEGVQFGEVDGGEASEMSLDLRMNGHCLLLSIG
jgi:hypothetical protein